MRRFWTASAVLLLAVFVVGGCNDYGNTFQNNTGAVVSFLSPSQISAGHDTFMLTLTGGGFVAKSVVYWNGKPLATTVPTDSSGNVLGNSVIATVTADLVAKSAVASVYTLNPFHGTGNNGLSNAINFNVNPPPNPVPILSTVAPNVSAASTPGSPPDSITLTGSNFLVNSDPMQASRVIWSMGATQTTLAVGTIQPNGIPATVTTDLLVNTSSSSVKATLTVVNPPSPPPPGCTITCTGGGGGGTSASVTFTICAAGQTTCTPLAAAKSTGAAASMVAEETPAVSLDGRFVSYTATQNEHAQVFLRDTCEGAAAGCQPRTTLLSAAADGSPANDESHAPSMSSDGRYVAFSSAATNLVENAPAGRQIYLRDTCAGAAATCKPSTQLISTDSNGALVGNESVLPSVSSSGRFIAFLAVTPSHTAGKSSAQANSPATGGNSGYRQIFVRDTCLGAANCTPKTTRISLQPGDGTESDAKPAGPALSGTASHLAIPGGNAATLFTHSVAVDDRVFLAITGAHH